MTHLDANPFGPNDRSTAVQGRAVSDIIDAVGEHRRRMARLAEDLDALRQLAAVRPGPPGHPVDDMLLDRLSDFLRTNDIRLEGLVARLQRDAVPDGRRPSESRRF